MSTSTWFVVCRVLVEEVVVVVVELVVGPFPGGS
jgi:hypothetical protein